MDSQFTAMAKVFDSSGIKSVRYAVWTEANGQDDLVWYEGHCTDGNDVYWVHIPFSEHNGEKGNYIVHMYAYDNAGNLTQAGLSYQFDAGDPVVNDFHAWELRDDAFTVSARVTSPNGLRSVRYAVWTEYDGQDDLVWYDAVYESTGQFYYIYVPFGEHKNERGNYFIHLYAYDAGDKLTNPGIGFIASAAVPSTEVTEGMYAIRSKLDASKGFDIWGNYSENQAAAVLHQWNGGDNQKFSVKAAGDGSYYIIATHSNKALEVYGGYGDNGASISQFTQNQTDAQRWYFVKNGDGTYTMRNKATGHVIDVDLMQTADGTKIQQYPYNGGDNQKFYLVPTDVSKWSVSLPSATRSYTGNVWEPEPAVTAGGVPMVKGRDYKVSYKNNVNVGTATAAVTGASGFTGSKNVTFKISANGQAGPASAPANGSGSVARQPMHRLYNPNSSEHFYTASDAERDHLVSVGWNSEGEGWTAPRESGTPVYRMYNANGGEHHYTMSEAEKDMLVSVGWSYEGVGWYSDDQKRVPLYRDYNPNAFANNHNYTTSAAEHEMLMGVGWRSEGYAWYGMQ